MKSEALTERMIGGKKEENWERKGGGERKGDREKKVIDYFLPEQQLRFLSIIRDN